MNFNIQESRSQVMSPSGRTNEIIRKSCLDCHTSKTPCWRGGPSGPRTLCNACGIRYRKKKMGLLGLNRQSSVLEKSKTRSVHTLKMELLTFGRGNRREVIKEEWRKNAGEEERQAAMLLMAMSCGSVYA